MRPSRGVRRWYRRLRLAWADRLGPFQQVAILIGVGIPLILLAIRFGLGGATDLVGWVVTIAFAAFVVYAQQRANRHNQILSELTTAYIISGDRALLDTFLGKLIGGSWRRSQLRPGEVVYDSLTEVADEGDFEQRRRIAEALPALGQLDGRQTIKVMRALRDDWDSRWKSDLRRRTVESLVVAPSGVHSALIDVARDTDVEDLLCLRENDEVYTAMAVAEALAVWRPRHRQARERVLANYMSFVTGHFTDEQIEAVEVGALVLAQAREDLTRAFSTVREVLASRGFLSRVAAVRAALFFVDERPWEGLEVLSLASGDSHKYVRRVAARERSVRFLLAAAQKPKHRDRAVSVLESLLLDQDDIIPLTTFDLLETWTSTKGFTLERACSLVKEHRSGPAPLMERVDRCV